MMIIQIFCTNYLLFRFSFELNNHKILRSLPYQPEHIPLQLPVQKGFIYPLNKTPHTKKTYSCTQKKKLAPSKQPTTLTFQKLQRAGQPSILQAPGLAPQVVVEKWWPTASANSLWSILNTTESERLCWAFRTRRSVPPPSQHLWHWEGETNGA